VSFLISICFFGFLLFDCHRERRQGSIPHLVQVLTHGSNSCRIDAIDPTRPFGAINHQAGLFEYLQVLGYGRPANWQYIRQFAYRAWATDEPLENRTSCRVAERLERLPTARLVSNLDWQEVRLLSS
jgi:hypothetical protein